MSYRAGAALVLVAATLWSLLGLGLRQIEAASTWQVLFWRSVGMAPTLFAAIALATGGKPLRALARAGLPGLIGGASLIFAFAGAIYSMQATSIANAVFLFAAAPLISAVLAWALLGEKVRAATWGAIALAGLGVFVMVREGLALGAGWGNLAALLSALGFAGFTVALRWGRQTEMLPATLIGSIFAALAAAAVTLAAGTTLAVSGHDMILSIAIGAFSTGLGLALFTAASRSLPAAEIGLLALLEVLLAPLWVWLLLGETASAGTLFGGGIVLVAIIANTVSARHAPRFA